MTFIGKYSIQGKFASQLMMIVTATALVCLGAYRGEVETLCTKAIRRWLECVGIG